MKKSFIIFVFIFICSSLFSQVSEGKSGVQKLSISKKGTELKKYSDESRGPVDNTPPLIVLQLPEIGIDSVAKTSSRTLTVKGKVEDAGGIFEVVVNGIEAMVSADGIFLAEIPQAFGKNTIRVVATDVSLNRSEIQFYSERTTAEIPERIVTEVKLPVNTYSIDFISPSGYEAVTATDKFTLQACIKSNAPIKQILIYRDDSFVNGYLSKQIIQQGDCAFMIDESVPLKLGMNEIRVEVYSGEDTIVKSAAIEYSFYAVRNFALIIANEKYDDPNIVELSEPLKDATELYNLLTKEYNFEPGNVTFLKNPTKAEIIGSLHRLRSVIKADDNFVIFYAGHGYWDEGMGIGYWLPKDAAKNNPVNWIPNTDLTNYLGAIKTKHTLLIADACFSGGIFKTRSAFSNTFAIEKLYQLNSRKAITSGTLTVVPDKSVFFQYLFKNLKDNKKEYISAEELFSNMRMAVIHNSMNVPQYGTIQNVGDEGGDFIFIKKKK
jgi:hypothetical protein